MNIASPILYEVNTRAWLSELSERLGRHITFSDVPDEEIDQWRKRGFTHIWLMGVWQVGPEARQIALTHWRNHWRTGVPSNEGDVHGSPYAIQEYAVDSRLGQPLELLMLKERLNRAGIKLIIDFVPNHVGIDSSEPRRYPARFVQSPTPSAGTFSCETKLGVRHLAHGRDPFFAPWMDTLQVDYRVAEAQEAMSLIAQTISMFGEGLRCDMAMLLLPEIFAATWKDFPVAGANATAANFWKRTIPKIRLLQPHVEMIAEAYWDREQELQDAGFDFTYNKRVTDYILRAQDKELREYLLKCPPEFLRRSVHFLENHDERRAASALEWERHQAAAALILFLPGMALLHDGQLEGRQKHAPIQMSRRPPENPDPTIETFYTDLLERIQHTRIRRGIPELLRDPGETIAIRWTDREGMADVGVVNLGSGPAELTLSGPWETIYMTRPQATRMQAGIIELASESAAILRQVKG